MTGDDVAPKPPGRLPHGASDEQRAAHDPATEAYVKAVIVIQKRNNTLWCYLAMVLDSKILMFIRHDCVDNKGLGDGRKAWVLRQQRLRSDETVTVFSVMRQLARLQLKENEALHNYFFRAHKLSTMPEHAEEHLAEPLLNVMVLNGLPERYEHFVV